MIKRLKKLLKAFSIAWTWRRHSKKHFVGSSKMFPITFDTETILSPSRRKKLMKHIEDLSKWLDKTNAENVRRHRFKEIHKWYKGIKEYFPERTIKQTYDDAKYMYEKAQRWEAIGYAYSPLLPITKTPDDSPSILEFYKKYGKPLLLAPNLHRPNGSGIGAADQFDVSEKL